MNIYTFTRKSHNIENRCSYYSILLYVKTHPNCTRAQWKKSLNLEDWLHPSYGHNPWTALKQAGYIESIGKKVPKYVITDKGNEFARMLLKYNLNK